MNTVLAELEHYTPEEDYYQVLGCHDSCSVDQILCEYKHRALLWHPDKNPSDDSFKSKFQKLQEAKETLCDSAKRRDYDNWRSSGLAIPYKAWLSVRGASTPVFHWVNPKQGRMLESQASRTPPKPPGTDIVDSKSQSSHSSRHREQPHPDSILFKFRNYQI